MGLTKASTGIKASETELIIEKRSPSDRVIALAGNPNVGKSTVFNALTGMNQHTGNWPGKTVTNAQGYCRFNGNGFVLVDIPGTYSLMAHSAEEEVARDFICFGDPDAVIVVCDATCLERNLNLVLQTLEITDNVVVCVNLMDEAKKKNISIDIKGLSERLGVPVVATVARKAKSLEKLMQAVSGLSPGENVYRVKYPEPIEAALGMLEPAVKKAQARINASWLCLKLLDYDEALTKTLNKYLGFDLLSDEAVKSGVEAAKKALLENGITSEKLRDMISTALVQDAERICAATVTYDKSRYNQRDKKIDRILISRLTGFPVMGLLLLAVFWLTITGANYPSELLSDGLFWVQDRLTDLFHDLYAPDWLHGVIVLGAYRVVAWVVSVMLPPMAIFFPLFTLLEDLGYLPRVAFMLDKYFKKCSACGKQALTMCMGFGCNAAGVVGCRIIDSPRERLIATITNNFVPCNGRFPTLIAIIAMFFAGASGLLGSALSALILTCIIMLGVVMTLAVSKLLSITVLKGVPSSFTLELPPYRRPQVGRIIVRSILDRTVFVLGRAVAAAAPAGVLIWSMANITIGGTTLLACCSGFLDPFARLLGLDGVILLAFILGFPANEIVIPIIIMSYMAAGTIEGYDSLFSLKELLVQNGWTWVTAVSAMLFSLMHWPCSTTCMTIKKETRSLKWTAVAVLAPTLTGFLICFIFNSAAKLLI